MTPLLECYKQNLMVGRLSLLLYILNPTDNTIENKSSVLNEGIYKGKTANSLNTIRIIVYNLIHKVYILNSPLYNLIKPMKQ